MEELLKTLTQFLERQEERDKRQEERDKRFLQLFEELRHDKKQNAEGRVVASSCKNQII